MTSSALLPGLGGAGGGDLANMIAMSAELERLENDKRSRDKEKEIWKNRYAQLEK
jgi:hypothetical protein